MSLELSFGDELTGGGDGDERQDGKDKFHGDFVVANRKPFCVYLHRSKVVNFIYQPTNQQPKYNDEINLKQ